LLQQAKNNGVPVLCLGGDKSFVNFEYSPEDSITFIASTMAPEYTDAVNDVVILRSGLQSGQLSWEFVPLGDVEKNPPVTGFDEVSDRPYARLEVKYIQALSAIEAGFQSSVNVPGRIEIYSLSGHCIYSGFADPAEKKILIIHGKGLYIVRLITGERVECQKVCVQ